MLQWPAQLLIGAENCRFSHSKSQLSWMKSAEFDSWGRLWERFSGPSRRVQQSLIWHLRWSSLSARVKSDRSQPLLGVERAPAPLMCHNYMSKGHIRSS